MYRATVGWHERRSGATDLYLRLFDGGEPVGDEVRIDTGTDAGPSDSWGLALAAEGDLVAAVWVDGRVDDSGATGLFWNFGTEGRLRSSDRRLETGLQLQFREELVEGVRLSCEAMDPRGGRDLTVAVEIEPAVDPATIPTQGECDFGDGGAIAVSWSVPDAL